MVCIVRRVLTRHPGNHGLVPSRDKGFTIHTKAHYYNPETAVYIFTSVKSTFCGMLLLTYYNGESSLNHHIMKSMENYN
jgi:hypothetical protein